MLPRLGSQVGSPSHHEASPSHPFCLCVRPTSLFSRLETHHHVSTLQGTNTSTILASARRRVLVGAVLVAGLTAAILTVVLELWRVSIRVPLLYLGDANWYLMIVKGLASGHWYYTNDQLGFPFGMEMYDFPTGDHFQLVIYKAIGALVGGDAALTVNLGYLAGFIATAVIAYFVLCALRVRPVIAGAIGILYAFLPDHFVRGTGHLFLSGYFAVPLAVLVILRQYDRPAFLSTDPSNPDVSRWSWRDRWGWLAVFYLVVVGTTGFYYGVFTGLFLVATLVFRLISERDRTAAISTLFLSSVLGLTILADLAPTFIYQAANGINELAVHRDYKEVEFYALKPIQMLLPTLNHRIEALRAPMAKALTTGQAPQSLGLVAAIGLVMVVLRTLARIGISTPKDPHSWTLDKLGVLTIGAILGAGMAGFAAGFGLLGVTYIRAWDRITIFVGFFALASVALVIDGWAGRRRLGPGALAVIAVSLMVVGVFDQTPAPSPSVDEVRAENWRTDRTFFEAVEADVGPNAAIYQLPITAYPEAGGSNKMIDYDHLRGYFHTETLKWSYGGMKGRVPAWESQVDALDMASRLRLLTLIGFDGLYIDRFGYADGGVALESAVKMGVGHEPITSQDGRLVFFNLKPLATDVHSATSDAAREDIITALLTTPVQVVLGGGFYGTESDGALTWSWASEQAELNLSNPSENTRHVVMTMGLQTGQATPSNVTVQLPGHRQDVQVSARPECLRMEFDLPPGSTGVSFATDAPRFNAPGDTRDLRVQVLNMTVQDLATIHFLDSFDGESC